MKKEISLAKGGASSEPTVTLIFTIKKKIDLKKTFYSLFNPLSANFTK